MKLKYVRQIKLISLQKKREEDIIKMKDRLYSEQKKFKEKKDNLSKT